MQFNWFSDILTVQVLFSMWLALRLHSPLNSGCMFQTELENKLQQQSSQAAQERAAEREKLSALQSTYDKCQANLKQLQSDFYGKESELLATRQDLKVWKTGVLEQIPASCLQMPIAQVPEEAQVFVDQEERCY